MPKSSITHLTFYPAYCFSLSPTYNTWARLTARDLFGLQERSGFEGQNLYFHLNHPIKWIRLVGMIVSFEIILNRFILLLDDFSGATIEVVCLRNAPAPVPSKTATSVDATAEVSDGLVGESIHDLIKLDTADDNVDASKTSLKGVTATGHEVDLSNVEIGSIVKIKGGIGQFRGQRQVLLERIWMIRTTAEEAAAWAENAEFMRDVLAVPWVLGEGEMRRARREADEGFAMEERKKKRKRRMMRTKKEEKERQGGKCSRRFGDKSGKVSGEDLRKRDKEKRRMENLERMKREEEEAKRKKEKQEVERRERKEAARKMQEERERKRRQEEEKVRKEKEEKERSAAERRRRNEAREKALREMGAGR